MTLYTRSQCLNHGLSKIHTAARQRLHPNYHPLQGACRYLSYEISSLSGQRHAVLCDSSSCLANGAAQNKRVHRTAES